MTTRITFIVKDDDKIVFPPQGGFPLERLRDYIERCRREQPFGPAEVRDLTELLCDDKLIASLEPDEKKLVLEKIRPTVNDFLQRQAKKLRANHRSN